MSCAMTIALICIGFVVLCVIGGAIFCAIDTSDGGLDWPDYNDDQ